MASVNIVEFLTARLDEREATAKATTPGPWGDHAPGSVYVEQSAVDDGHLVAEFPTCEDHEDRREADAAHIALNDPVYVLADLAAKRRILALHQPGGQFSELRDAPQRSEEHTSELQSLAYL